MEKSFTWKLDRFTGLNVPEGGDLELRSSDSPYMVNFKITEGGALKKRQGYRTVQEAAAFDAGGFRGFWAGRLSGRTVRLAVVGGTLLDFENGFAASPKTVTIAVHGTGEVSFFPFFGKLYLLTGMDILVYDGKALSSVEPYVPLVMVATPPDGSGVLYEEKNLLTNTVRQSFSPDGKSLHFNPVIRDVERIHWVKRGGELVDPNTYYWDLGHSTVRFTEAPAAGVDDLEIQYEIRGEDASDRILHCRYASGFGGSDTRAFLYGNEDDPAMRYHSGLVEGKPSLAYFPETAYTRIGSGETITAILRHYDRQLIFTPRAAYYSFLEYRTGADGQLLPSFPVLPLSESYGNVAPGQALLMENTPVTLDETGLCRWVSTNIRDERNAQKFSGPIARALQGETLSEAKLFYRRATSELMLCVGEHLFVYHEKAKLFYSYGIPQVLGFLEEGGALWFYTKERLCLVGGTDDDGKEIRALWQSKLLDLTMPDREKQIHHMGVLLAGKIGEILSVCFEKDSGGELTVSHRLEKETPKLFLRRADLRRVDRMRITLCCDGAGEATVSHLELSGTAMNKN